MALSGHLSAASALAPAFALLAALAAFPAPLEAKAQKKAPKEVPLEEKAEKAVRAIFDDLMFHARPAHNVELEYEHFQDRIRVDCAGGMVVIGRGAAPAVTVSCEEKEGLKKIVLGVGAGALEAAKNDDGMALVLAHELGHIVHDHIDKLTACLKQLHGEWELVHLAGLTADLRKEREEVLVSDDVEGARLILDSEWAEFEAHPGYRKRYEAMARQAETQADEYACALAGRAGFNPENGSGLFFGLFDLHFRVDKARWAPSPIHPTAGERFEHVLECGLARQGPLPKPKPSPVPCDLD